MMQREQATEKELALLLRRHNKIAKAKLKSAEIDIPDYILTILCQKNARTDSQVEEIESFRANAIEQLLSVSNQLHEERLKKAKRTREANLEKDPRYVKHFGIWINSTLPTAKLNREHYAKIDRYSSFHSPAYTKYLAERGDERFVLDETGECGIYSEEWCKTHQKCCLKNFDINMERFASLDAEAFERVLSRFIKGRKFQEIYRLDEPVCIEKPYSLGISGFVYIMVFDAYKTARLIGHALPISGVCKSGDIVYFHLTDYIDDVSLRFVKYETPFRYHGCIIDGFIGNAPTQLCDARKIKETDIFHTDFINIFVKGKK